MFNIDIKCTENGCLYRKNDSNGKIDYYEYHTNYLFLVYMHSFDLEKKFVNYEDYNISYLDPEIKEVCTQTGLEYSNYLKKLIIELLLYKDFSLTEFKNLLKKIDTHLSFRSFIIGYNASHYGKYYKYLIIKKMSF